MNPDDFSRILFAALEDPDERLSTIARKVKTDIEAGAIESARAGVLAMSERMRQLRILRARKPS